MKRLLLAFLLLTFALRAVAADQAPTVSLVQRMREMRLEWLNRRPEGAQKSSDDVVAVLMDWPVAGHVVTIAASPSGEASVITTSGFSIVGDGGSESVREAARTFIAAARRYLKVTTPTSEFQYPDRESLRFYMVTPGGVRFVSYQMKDVEQEDSPARVLYAFAQHLLTTLRRGAEERK